MSKDWDWAMALLTHVCDVLRVTPHDRVTIHDVMIKYKDTQVIRQEPVLQTPQVNLCYFKCCHFFHLFLLRL
jgi:hypothetical protein